MSPPPVPSAAPLTVPTPSYLSSSAAPLTPVDLELGRRARATDRGGAELGPLPRRAVAPRAGTGLGPLPWMAGLGVLWKHPAVVAFSFADVPALLGYLGDAAGSHVPAWMPLVYSLASFLLGALLFVDALVSDEEWEEWARRREREGELAFLESEEVLWRVTRRLPAAALAASAAGEAVLRAAAQVTGLDLQPPIWVAFLLFGVLLGVPYGVFSASFDPAVEAAWLGWEEFVKNIHDVVLQAGDGRGRSNI